MRPKFHFPDNYFSIKGQIGNESRHRCVRREGERSRRSLSFFRSPLPLPRLRKNRINKRNRRYVEVGLRAIPRVNSTRFSTFAIKGRTYPSADPSTLLYLSRSIPRCLRGCRIDAPTGGFY